MRFSDNLKPVSDKPARCDCILCVYVCVELKECLIIENLIEIEGEFM